MISTENALRRGCFGTRSFSNTASQMARLLTPVMGLLSSMIRASLITANGQPLVPAITVPT